MRLMICIWLCLSLFVSLPVVSAGEDAPPAAPAGDQQAAAAQTPAPPDVTRQDPELTEIPAPVLGGGEFFRNVSVNEPVYFIFGWRHETGWDAKFQLSFKYRFMDHGYFGFTQTSVWDLSADSAPFHDSSYRPSLFYYYNDGKKHLSNGYMFRLMAGFEHESNGQAGLNSRTINLAFARPAFLFGNRAGDYLIRIEPKLWAYLGKSENPDIDNYRGYGDLLFVFDAIKDFGFLDGLQISTDLRKGNRNDYGSVQVDVSYPLGSITYVYVQYFSGWGETILDYKKRLPAQVRAGFMVVRW